MSSLSWDTVKNLPMLGLILTLVSASLFGLCNVIVKQVSNIDPFTIAVFRFVGIALPASTVVIYRNEVGCSSDFSPKFKQHFFAQNPLPQGKRWVLIVRSVMGATNLIIHFYGLKHMPMADVNMISAGSPVWVVIFARIFLKEPLIMFDIINIFVTLLGILFIIKPPFIFGYDPSFILDNQYYIAGLIGNPCF